MAEISREDSIKGLNTISFAAMMAKENKPISLGMTLDEVNECIKKAISDMVKHDGYETKLKNAYGECDGLLDVVVDCLVKQAEEHKIDQPIKSRLLTDEDVDAWEQAKSDREKLKKIEQIFEPRGFGEYPSNAYEMMREIKKIVKE